MIIMLNGSFGVGKTSIALILLKMIPNAMLFDPEEVGQMVRTITDGIREHRENTDDFQDISLWRVLSVETAKQLRLRYNRTLIVPMTLANPLYFDEIKTGFTTFDSQLYHFCLTAPLSVVHQRLLERGDNPNSWCWGKAIEYVPLFTHARFETHLDTENHAMEAIAQKIVNKLPMT